MLFKKLSQSKVKVGDTAPDFTLISQSGKKYNLKDLVKEKNLVLYFYPKDNTPGCTAEACAFRDSYEIFKDAGAEVVGISSNSVESHKIFTAKNRLPFILLSDNANLTRKLYDVPSTFGMIPGRVTFIIDGNRMIRYVFSSQFNTKKHIDEALAVLKKMNNDS